MSLWGNLKNFAPNAFLKINLNILLEECLVKIFSFLDYLRVFFNNIFKFLKLLLNTVSYLNSKFKNKCKDNYKSKFNNKCKDIYKSKVKTKSVLNSKTKYNITFKTKSKIKKKTTTFDVLATNLVEKKLKADKRIGPHNRDILSILFGSLLGDCHAEFRKQGLGTRFTFYQEGSHSTYLIWLHDLISKLGYCSSKTPAIQTRLGVKGQIRKIIRFRT
jgi:hypothetical protein